MMMQFNVISISIPKEHEQKVEAEEEEHQLTENGIPQSQSKLIPFHHIRTMPPVRPPQPQWSYALCSHNPVEESSSMRVLYGQWEEWQGRVPVQPGHIKSVVCLLKRNVRDSEDRPFESDDDVKIKRVDNEWKIMKPTAEKLTKSTCYIINEHRIHGHYDYNIYEGVPIFLGRHANLEALTWAIMYRKQREKEEIAEKEKMEKEFFELCDHLSTLEF